MNSWKGFDQVLAEKHSILKQTFGILVLEEWLGFHLPEKNTLQMATGFTPFGLFESPMRQFLSCFTNNI